MGLTLSENMLYYRYSPFVRVLRGSAVLAGNLGGWPFFIFYVYYTTCIFCVKGFVKEIYKFLEIFQKNFFFPSTPCF